MKLKHLSLFVAVSISIAMAITLFNFPLGVAMRQPRLYWTLAATLLRDIPLIIIFVVLYRRS
jgi:ABC-type methionine transport system permease subunit